MLFGYARVSSKGQHLDRQIKALTEYGVDPNNIFTDKITGAKASRPALDDMISRLRENDSVVIVSLDRLGRSTKDLFDLMDKFHSMKVNVVSIKDNLNTEGAYGELIFGIMAVIAQFQRNLIKENQKEGIEIAKEQGRMKGRPHTPEEKINRAISLYMSKQMSVREIASVCGISVSTLYNELKRRGLSRNQRTTA